MPLAVAWLLMLLQLLLLLGVVLLHLLGLLLMALFHLLLLRVACGLLGGALMLGFLLLLELLVLLVLFCDQLILLLLILLIEFGITGVGWRGGLVRLYLGCMRWVDGSRGCIGGTRFWSLPIGGWVIGRSSLARTDDALSAKLRGSGGRGDWRLALVDRSAELRVGTRCLEVLHLSGHRSDVSLPRCRFLL